MKKQICYVVISFFFFSCQPEKKEASKFITYLETIPELDLPFSTNGRFELQSKIKTDTNYLEYNHDVYGVYGKRKVNDSIYFIINLLASDYVFPELMTYTRDGIKIDELTLINSPGGSSGYDETGISYMCLDKNYIITITDSIETFERDTLGNILESSRKNRVDTHHYQVNPSGKITKYNDTN